MAQVSGEVRSKDSNAESRWLRLPGWRTYSEHMDTESRRRKRDVALQLLGSALRFSSGAAVDSSVEGVLDETDGGASDTITGSVSISRRPGSASQILVRSSLPTVALQTYNGSEDLPNKPIEQADPDKVSILSSRLAMQLKLASERASSKDKEDAITVCRVCLDFAAKGDYDGVSNLKRRRRSGTLTRETSKRERRVSQTSSQSDQTIRERSEHVRVKVRWEEGVFAASSLHLNPLSTEVGDVQPKADSCLQLVGGTFLVESEEDDSGLQDIVREVLNIGLYAACAMIMESSVLRDFNMEEEEMATADEPEAIVSELVGIPSPTTTQDSPEAQPRKSSRWLWGMLHNADPHTDTAADSGNEDHAVKSKKHLTYSGRIGKLLGSLRRTSPVASDVDQAGTANGGGHSAAEEPPEARNSKEGDADVNDDIALAVSPFYHDQARGLTGDRDDTDCGAQLISSQTISLTVLDGLDVPLSVCRTQSGTFVKRTPLATKTSYTASEPKATASVISTASASSSIRSSSQSPQEDSSTTQMSSAILPGASGFSEGRQMERKVQYYQRTGACRDVSLGQAIEEMVAKAAILSKTAKQPTKKAKGGVEKAQPEVDFIPTYRIAQYLHGHDRISVMARLTQEETSGLPIPEPVSRSLAEGRDREDASNIAEQLCIDSMTRQSKHRDISMWTVNVNNKEETAARVMSDLTYLSSYGFFLEMLLSHPRLAHEKHDVVRMVQMGNITLKFQIQPIDVFELLIEGPVVCSGRRNQKEKERSEARKDEKLLERTRLEIQDFYSSVKRHISAIEHVIVARELDEKGMTIKRSASSKKGSVGSYSFDKPSIDDPTWESTPSPGPLHLLSELKDTIRKKEFDLYDDLKHARAACINDIRLRFERGAKSTRKRLSAWVDKHLDKKEIKDLATLDLVEPDFFADAIHTFPGSRYFFREAEPLSIVAYTLSSRDFDTEMHHREQKHPAVLDRSSKVTAPSTDSKLSISMMSSHCSTQDTLNPHEEGDFDDAEPIHSRIKRKRRAKGAGVLSFTLKRTNSDFSSQAGQDSATTKDTADSIEGTVTPTASQISSSTFDTVSHSNDTFRAHVTQYDPKVYLGESLEGGITAPSVPLNGKITALPSYGSISRHSAARETSDSATLLSVPTSERRAVSQPAESMLHDTKAPPVSPHIKHTIISGNLKVSCVSWFAEDFSKLRSLWNIDDDFIESMSRCKSWSTMGGKSKSGFYVTLDGKWIAKQLLSVWSVDEKESFLEFAPHYLQYMMDSAVEDRPTLLVKIAGVYTVKLKDIKTGEVKLKMSVQILENVFAGDGGKSIRFDVKGIKDRRTQIKKEKEPKDQEEDSQLAPVWWDGEWIDCFQARAFVPQDHKAVFRRAMANDMLFLTKLNVMDYSLLIGAQERETEGDEEGRVKCSAFTVRIVDFLGAFTIAKAIESSGKRAMKSQAPTVIPPSEYAARFASNLDTYFTGCPM